MSVAARIVVSAVAAAALVALAAGCGGSKKGTGATTTTAAAATPAEQKAQIRGAWERFFAGSTPASEKEALLEHGSLLAPAIEAQAKSPLAKSSSAKVTNVTLNGPAKATVTYTILLGGKPALQHQQGTAVKSGSSWKVGLASFCRLLSLQGPAPKACSGAA
jgi:hypothetical protein